MKHQENKLVTQSGQNRESSNLLLLTSQNAKNSITISLQKGPAPCSSFGDLFIQKFSLLETQWLHKCSYK
jgi:hypothetical protein